MKSRLILLFCLHLLTTVATAENLVEPSTGLDTEVLDNTRLFFSQAQRQRGANTPKPLKASKKPLVNKHSTALVPTALIARESGLVVRYNGVLRSERGIQLMINGVLWRPGLAGVIRARIQQNSNLLEIETDSGKTHRLQPGQSIELLP